MNELIENAPLISTYNRKEMSSKEKCGCFFCLRIFYTKDIEKWADRGRTAVCPHCGVDTIVYDTDKIKINKDILIMIKKRWFY